MAKNEHISLEELLKLKRAEHPSEADWLKFDTELKRKFAKKIIEKPSFFDVFFNILSPKAAFSCAALAIAFTAFLPYLSDNFSAHIFSSSSRTDISTTPLPLVKASFASNEIPSRAKSESFVSAEMNSEDSDGVRYVFNNLGGFASNTVF